MRAVHSLAIATLAAIGAGIAGAGGSSSATGSSFACPAAGPARLVMIDQHALSGDVDGDGRPDRVFTARVRNSTDFCRYALVVVSRGRYRTLPLHKDSLGPGIAVARWEAGTPAVDVLARLDRVPGAEMLVAIWEGGSGRRFDAVFTMRRGRLDRMDVSGVGTAGNVLDFGSGGSAAVTLGCAKDKPGRFYELDGLHETNGEWKITRTYYAFRNQAVVRLFERSEGVHPDLTPDFHGLLTGCAIATNWGRR
jgi:hypothetical protein